MARAQEAFTLSPALLATVEVAIMMVRCFFKYDGDFKGTFLSEVYHGINKKLVAAHNLPACRDALHAAWGARAKAAALTATAGKDACGRARATSHAGAAVMLGGAVDAAAEAEASATMSIFGF
jgi:hypothetical protein